MPRTRAHCRGVLGRSVTGTVLPNGGQLPAPPGTLGNTDVGTFGPMGRSAEDLALGLDVLAGPGDAEGLCPSWPRAAGRCRRCRSCTCRRRSCSIGRNSTSSANRNLTDEPDGFDRKGALIRACPCCEGTRPSGQSQEQRDNLDAIAEVALMLGHDIDGFAAFLEDFDLC